MLPTVRLQEETSRVEDVLSDKPSIERLLACFVSAKANSFENLLDPLLKICRLSPLVVLAMSNTPSFFQKLAERLSHSKAVVRLNLLRILRIICDSTPQRTVIVEQYGFRDIVRRLSERDGAVLVRELAREILPTLAPPTGLPEPTAEPQSRNNSKPVLRRKVPRRSASETSSSDSASLQSTKPRRLKPKITDIGWQDR